MDRDFNNEREKELRDLSDYMGEQIFKLEKLSFEISLNRIQEQHQIAADFSPSYN